MPLGITYLADPAVAAAEIRRNAAARLHVGDVPRTAARDRPALAVGARPLGPDHRGVRGDRHRDLAARRQFGDLSVPAGLRRRSSSAATLFGQLSLGACAEWLWSGYPVKHPTLKIAMSEGGIGWVAMLLDRLDYIVDRSSYGLGWDERPADVLERNFWFCTLDDPSTIDTRHRIGVENIMVEVDYPHGDSTWPDTQAVIEKAWGHIPADELRAMCSENAAALYRHPLPAVVLPTGA